MSILNGMQIRERDIMSPHEERGYVSIGRGTLSYGEGPAGYDIRVEFDDEGKIPFVIMEPGDFLLASSVEYFTMPNDVLGIVHDKSSWARSGLAVQNTVIEPGWCGYLTLELTNHSKEPIRLERCWPIAQVIFHFMDIPVEEGYRGKYNNQKRGPQVAL